MSSREDYHSIQEAGMYNVLSDYYKYTNPELHVYYYHKHLQSLQHAIKHDNKQVVKTDKQRQKEYGTIRILHGSETSPKLDIYINGIRIFKEVSYKTMSNDFTLLKGRYQIDIYEAGKMVHSLCSQKVSIEANLYHTLVITNHNNYLKIHSYPEQPVVPPNESKLRFIHSTSRLPTIDIAVQKGDIVFSQLKPKTASNFLGLYPMTVLLEIRKAESKEVLATLPAISLEPNKGYTAFLLDTYDKDNPFEMVIFSL